MESRIEEQPLWLFAERDSAATIPANRPRTCFAAFEGYPVDILRRFGPKGTYLASARVDTIRSHLPEIAGRVKVAVRRISLSLPTAFPLQDLYRKAHERPGAAKIHRCGNLVSACTPRVPDGFRHSEEKDRIRRTAEVCLQGAGSGPTWEKHDPRKQTASEHVVKTGEVRRYRQRIPGLDERSAALNREFTGRNPAKYSW